MVIGLGITEHFSQETYRLLIGFQKVLLANVLLFIRTFGWSIVIIYNYYNNIEITIRSVLEVWLFFNSITILYLILYTFIKKHKNIIKINVDVKWIKQGVQIGLIFFVATISLKLIEYANRFIVDYFMGKKLAGIFLFYSNISILITVYINTVVISFELPALITSAKSPAVFPLLKKFKKSLVIHILISAGVIILAIEPLLIWQGKIMFKQYLSLIYFMVVSMALMNFSLLYHFKLYIFHKDKTLLKVMVVSAFLSLILSILFTYFFGIYGTASAFVISSLILCYFRFIEAKRINYD
ncbi:polysaccharide biosynthesis C-terminal domain-containing protein [Tenacibaculum sp. UWU-22]|uniref:polysaccharide biosynthesis C-terminal domain-containing protein n=1 Tax=Tenacibaculum sp. UWU-22 TaxID=3234187 RepID=UPI0034DB3C56